MYKLILEWLGWKISFLCEMLLEKDYVMIVIQDQSILKSENYV